MRVEVDVQGNNKVAWRHKWFCSYYDMKFVEDCSRNGKFGKEEDGGGVQNCPNRIGQLWQPFIK